MVIQLLSISFLFLAHYMLFIILSTIRLWLGSYFLAYLIYGIPILIPFVSLISLPEIFSKLKKLFSCQQQNQIRQS